MGHSKSELTAIRLETSLFRHETDHIGLETGPLGFKMALSGLKNGPLRLEMISLQTGPRAGCGNTLKFVGGGGANVSWGPR